MLQKFILIKLFAASQKEKKKIHGNSNFRTLSTERFYLGNKITFLVKNQSFRFINNLFNNLVTNEDRFSKKKIKFMQIKIFKQLQRN